MPNDPQNVNWSDAKVQRTGWQIFVGFLAIIAVAGFFDLSTDVHPALLYIPPLLVLIVTWICYEDRVAAARRKQIIPQMEAVGLEYVICFEDEVFDEYVTLSLSSRFPLGEAQICKAHDYTKLLFTGWEDDALVHVLEIPGMTGVFFSSNAPLPAFRIEPAPPNPLHGQPSRVDVTVGDLLDPTPSDERFFKLYRVQAPSGREIMKAITSACMRLLCDRPGWHVEAEQEQLAVWRPGVIAPAYWIEFWEAARGIFLSFEESRDHDRREVGELPEGTIQCAMCGEGNHFGNRSCRMCGEPLPW